MLPRCPSRSVDPVDPGDTEELVPVQHEEKHQNCGRYWVVFKGPESILMAYLSI